MPISFHAIGSSPPSARCSSGTATSGSTTSGSATSAIGWASRRGAPRSRSARDVLPRVSQPAWAPRRGDRRRRGGRAESARPALGRCACHRGESRDHAPPGGARGGGRDRSPAPPVSVGRSRGRVARHRGDRRSRGQRPSVGRGRAGGRPPECGRRSGPLQLHRARGPPGGKAHGRRLDIGEKPSARSPVAPARSSTGRAPAKALEILRSADVVVYDRLVAPSLLAEAPPGAERVFVGKRPHSSGADLAQSENNALLVERARRGLTVVRLKGGDPFVFGRGAEECEALRAAGVPFRVVPGVTSAIAVPAAAGIPVTHRRLASAFAVVTGHECEGVSTLVWESLARVPTLVVLMGLSALPEITARLLEQGADPDTPAAVIASGTLPDQRVVVATLATLAARVAEEGLEPPATVVVGEVVRVRELLSGEAEGLTHPARGLVSQP